MNLMMQDKTAINSLTPGAVIYVSAQIAFLSIELQKMLAANAERARQNYAFAYTDADFVRLREKYEAIIGHAAILALAEDAPASVVTKSEP